MLRGRAPAGLPRRARRMRSHLFNRVISRATVPMEKRLATATRTQKRQPSSRDGTASAGEAGSAAARATGTAGRPAAGSSTRSGGVEPPLAVSWYGRYLAAVPGLSIEPPPGTLVVLGRSTRRDGGAPDSSPAAAPIFTAGTCVEAPPLRSANGPRASATSWGVWKRCSRDLAIILRS